jgi:hypothetical protein
VARGRFPVAALATPAQLELPHHDLDLVWHERFSQDAGHIWLRTAVARVAKR